MENMRKRLNWHWSKRTVRCPVSTGVLLLLLCLALFSAPYPAARAAAPEAGVSVADLNAMEELVINRKGIPPLFVGDVVAIAPDSGNFVLVPAEQFVARLQDGTTLFQVVEKTPTYLAMNRITQPGNPAAVPAVDTLVNQNMMQTDYLSELEFSIPRGDYTFILGDVVFYNEDRLRYIAVPISYLLGELKEKTPLYLITEVGADSYLIKPVNAGEGEEPVITAGLIPEEGGTF